MRSRDWKVATELPQDDDRGYGRGRHGNHELGWPRRGGRDYSKDREWAVERLRGFRAEEGIKPGNAHFQAHEE